MKRNDIIFLLVSTVILTIAWILFNVIHASTTSTIGNDLNQQIESIAPAFDANTINALNSKQKIVPLYSIPGISPSPTVTIPPSPSPTPTIGVSFSPTQPASTGGILQ